MRPDPDEMCEVKEVSASMQERRKSIANDIAGDVAKLRDMFVRYLTISGDMFSRYGRDV